MSERRRDSKNRVLRSGKGQRKDGRYVYKYVDTFGKPQFVCSWKLVSMDKTPAGKREDTSLREKEKEIQKDLDDGIDTIGKKMTVRQLYAEQIRHRGNMEHNTKLGRERLMRILEQDRLGSCPIGSVKLSDAEEWALRMREKGFSYKVINNDKRSLKAAFYTVIQGDRIRKNSFDLQFSDALDDDTEPKVPLMSAQEENFLSFIQGDKVYQEHYGVIVILLGIGLRISELCGLTDKDLDFEDWVIIMSHQLLRSTGVGYYTDEPKTQSGVKKTPASEEVYQAFQRVIKNRKGARPFTINGHANFLFLKQNDYPMTAVDCGGMFGRLVEKYNKSHEEALSKTTTPYAMRHTFCTRLANTGMNPKALQYTMGYSSITMMLNYYAYATSDSARAEMERLVA